VLGHALLLLRDPLRFLSSLPRYGPMVTMRLGAIDAVVLCDPGLTRQMLLNDRVFDKGGPFFDRLRDAVTGDGLGTCPHSVHRRQRRLCQPAFTSGRLNSYAPAFAEAAVTTIGGWRDGQVLDVSGEMYTLTMRAVLRTLFSTSLPDHALPG